MNSYVQAKRDENSLATLGTPPFPNDAFMSIPRTFEGTATAAFSDGYWRYMAWYSLKVLEARRLGTQGKEYGADGRAETVRTR